MLRFARLALSLSVLVLGGWTFSALGDDLLPIPDRLVVLTFDDGT